MKDPKELLKHATRQYRHNTGEGFVMGYDAYEAEEVVQGLLDRIEELEAQHKSQNTPQKKVKGEMTLEETLDAERMEFYRSLSAEDQLKHLIYYVLAETFTKSQIKSQTLSEATYNVTNEINRLRSKAAEGQFLANYFRGIIKSVKEEIGIARNYNPELDEKIENGKYPELKKDRGNAMDKRIKILARDSNIRLARIYTKNSVVFAVQKLEGWFWWKRWITVCINGEAFWSFSYDLARKLFDDCLEGGKYFYFIQSNDMRSTWQIEERISG